MFPCCIAGVDSTTLLLFIYAMPQRGAKPGIDAAAALMPVFPLGVDSLGPSLGRGD